MSVGGELSCTRVLSRQNRLENFQAAPDIRRVQKPSQIPRLLRKKKIWAEKWMWALLRDRRFSGYKFRRQHRFGNYILDFFCVEANLNLELDGRMHGFPQQHRLDSERDAWLETRGIKVLRFWNSQLRAEKETIREIIWNALQERAPQPVPGYCRSSKDNTEKQLR